MKVMIVDDEEELLECLVDTLTQAGHEVFACTKGSDGLKILKYHRIDCVITDLKMPEIRGQYLVEILKAGYPEIPVIVLSGHIQSEKELRDLGVSKVFSKPVDVDHILEGIREVASY